MKQLTPMQEAMRNACRTKNVRKLARLYRAAKTVDTRVSGAVFLAAQFNLLGNQRATRAMFKRARLHAADDYARLLYINMVQESLSHAHELS